MCYSYYVRTDHSGEYLLKDGLECSRGEYSDKNTSVVLTELFPHKMVKYNPLHKVSNLHKDDRYSRGKPHVDSENRHLLQYPFIIHLNEFTCLNNMDVM